MRGGSVQRRLGARKRKMRGGRGRGAMDERSVSVHVQRGGRRR